MWHTDDAHTALHHFWIRSVKFGPTENANDQCHTCHYMPCVIDIRIFIASNKGDIHESSNSLIDVCVDWKIELAHANYSALRDMLVALVDRARELIGLRGIIKHHAIWRLHICAHTPRAERKEMYTKQNKNTENHDPINVTVMT